MFEVDMCTAGLLIEQVCTFIVWKCFSIHLFHPVHPPTPIICPSLPLFYPSNLLLVFPHFVLFLLFYCALIRSVFELFYEPCPCTQQRKQRKGLLYLPSLGFVHYAFCCLCHQRWMEVMFSLLFVCLSVCLSVCEQDISKRYRQIWTRLGAQFGCVTRRKWLDFGEDPDPDPNFFQWFFTIKR